ncbi:MAG: glycosyltransferase [Verrucomicrobia bacterium]|nr:glycosyltransferase [Verrucomicrobiota bacterium]
MSLLVSVIIPAHNEQEYLPATLKALRGQTYGCYEVLVVANGCSDETARAAQGDCDRLVQLDEKGLSRARNLGGRKARGELLVFLDADTLLERHALGAVVREFTRDDAMGTIKGKPNNEKLAYRVLYWTKNFFHRTGLHRGSAGVIICWKDGFKTISGFDEMLQVCEVGDFMSRMKKCGRYKYISSTTATTSMRRYEQRGVGPMAWHWLKVWVISWFSDLRHRPYETVR